MADVSFFGSGATCDQCGFHYWEHKGHILASPVCRIASLEAALAEAREFIKTNYPSDHLDLVIQRDALTVALAEAQRERDLAVAQKSDAEKSAASWKMEVEMFAKAWRREIEPLVPKTHLIDALVLTTQKVIGERDALRARHARCVEALKAYVNCKMFRWRFDHSGVMGSTQLAERERFLEIEAQGKAALEAGKEKQHG